MVSAIVFVEERFIKLQVSSSHPNEGSSCRWLARRCCSFEFDRETASACWDPERKGSYRRYLESQLKQKKCSLFKLLKWMLFYN